MPHRPTETRQHSWQAGDGSHQPLNLHAECRRRRKRVALGGVGTPSGHTGGDCRRSENCLRRSSDCTARTMLKETAIAVRSGASSGFFRAKTGRIRSRTTAGGMGSSGVFRNSEPTSGSRVRQQRNAGIHQGAEAAGISFGDRDAWETVEYRIEKRLKIVDQAVRG